MITYKNISYSAKTFYGVEFQPGDTKSVPGYINDSGMLRIFVDETKVQAPKIVVTKEPNTRKKAKTTEPEKVEVAETQENKIELSEEETSNGNQC